MPQAAKEAEPTFAVSVNNGDNHDVVMLLCNRELKIQGKDA